METINFFSSQIISTIGWTIIHSLWQGTLISLLLATLLIFINKKKTLIRSYISYIALILIFIISIRTYIDLDKDRVQNHQVGTSTELSNMGNNSTQNEEVLTDTFLSEDTNSIVLEYTTLARGFLSSNIAVIVLLWFAGIIIMSIRLLGGIIYTQRLKIRDVIPVNQFWEEKIENLRTKFEITKNVKLLQSKLVESPVTIGYLKPVILLPLGLISGIPQNQLEIIIAHELAHIKRADYLLNIFQSIIEVLFFFNPAVWWISKTIRQEREYLSDDIAIEICGNSITLAKALLFVQNSDCTKTKIAMAAIGNKHSLMGRIKRMTHSKNERKTFSAVLTIIPMLLLVTSIACSGLDSEISRKGNTFAHQSDVATASFVSSSAQSDQFASASFGSSSSNTVSYTINDFDDDRIKISFHEDNIYWKAYFEEDELVELYKDGDKVSKSDFSKYEDLIYKRYEEFTENMADLDIQMDELKIDLEQLKVDLSGLKDIKIDFDSEEFALEMKEMKRELKNGLAELTRFMQ